MSFTVELRPRLHGVFSDPIRIRSMPSHSFLYLDKRRFRPVAVQIAQSNQELLVVVGGGPAGVFGAVRAKIVAPHLKVAVFEKGKLLSKVRISGGGRCNVTNGHCIDPLTLAQNYPRGYKELRGSFFSRHGPMDTMTWFSDRGVELKSGTAITAATITSGEKFLLKMEKGADDSDGYFEADYLLIATGSSRQGYTLATQLGHSIVYPVPSLFTFKIEDPRLTELAGVTFSKVKANIELEKRTKKVAQLTQVGPMLVTHRGVSGPVILQLSAWAARELFTSNYRGVLYVDFTPDIHIENTKKILIQQKHHFAKQKVFNSCPPEFGLGKRFWKYILDRQVIDGHSLWASVSNNSINSIAALLKQCSFTVAGKGEYKEEFVTAGGVPLNEISMKTMESKLRPHLFFAGEVLDIDGVTGGFNFQNAWSGGYVAGTAVGELVKGASPKDNVA